MGSDQLKPRCGTKEQRDELDHEVVLGRPWEEGCSGRAESRST